MTESKTFVRDKIIAFKIDEVGHDWLKWRAKFEGLTVSELIRAVMAGYCAWCINLPQTEEEMAMYSAGKWSDITDDRIPGIQDELKARETTL